MANSRRILFSETYFLGTFKRIQLESRVVKFCFANQTNRSLARERNSESCNRENTRRAWLASGKAVHYTRGEADWIPDWRNARNVQKLAA
jgi:hypothetical protein